MNSYLIGLLLVVPYFILWMFLAFRWKDNSIVDVVWGTGIILMSWCMVLLYGTIMSWVLAFLVTLSQSRLSVHIFLRKRNIKEDWRYAQWREDWGKTFYWRSFLQVFLLQAIINWIIALPLMDLSTVFNFSAIQIIGLLIWAIGFVTEAIADYQMEQFKKNLGNKGKLMRLGLWKYSRHPNYFGQILHWCGIFLLVSNGNNVWISLMSPVCIIILLTSVSGIPMLEKKYKTHPDYANWIKETPALIPRIK